MPNILTTLQKQIYAKKVQSELFFKVTALSMANMVDMPHGITYHKPQIDFNGLTSYVKNTDIVVNPNTTTDETLTINQTPLVPYGIDQVELLEISYSLLDELATRASQTIREDLDGNFFNQILNATNGNVAPVTLSPNNTVNTFSQAVAELVNNGVDASKLFSTIDPHTKAMIGESALGNTYKEADLAFRRGFRGTFAETQVNVSTLLTATTSLLLPTIPVANDTVTINGVVFTFKAALAVAGDVLIGANVAASRANFTAAINGAAGAGTTYSEVTSRERNRKLAGITATVNVNNVDLVSLRGYRKVSQTLSPVGDKFAAVIINNAIMEKGAISLAIQKGINLVTRDKPLQIGTNFFTWMRYGIATFLEGRDRMYRLQIIAQAAQ